MSRFFFFLCALLIGYLGFRAGEGLPPFSFSQSPPKKNSFRPEQEFPVTEYKTFTFILYASNQAPWCERLLASIFTQDYESYRVIFIDDRSSDGTYEIAQNYILQNGQENRVILIRNEIPLGLSASLCRAAESCLDHEILIPLEAKDWLSQEGVLTRLNAVFQNPDVWVSCSKAISYPTFDLEGPGGVTAFYATLLHRLPEEKRASDPLHAILKLSTGRTRPLPEPLLFSNQAGFGTKY